MLRTMEGHKKNIQLECGAHSAWGFARGHLQCGSWYRVRTSRLPRIQTETPPRPPRDESHSRLCTPPSLPRQPPFTVAHSSPAWPLSRRTPALTATRKPSRMVPRSGGAHGLASFSFSFPRRRVCGSNVGAMRLGDGRRGVRDRGSDRPSFVYGPLKKIWVGPPQKLSALFDDLNAQGWQFDVSTFRRFPLRILTTGDLLLRNRRCLRSSDGQDPQRLYRWRRKDHTPTIFM